MKTLWTNRRLFGGITLIYALLSLILVHGLASTVDVTGLKKASEGGAVTASLNAFTGLIGSTGSGTTAAASSYQFFMTVIASLALIWALRQVAAGVQAKTKAAYYQGMYPLIPFIVVLIVIGVQLIPFVVGSTLYSLVITNGIAIFAYEKFAWGLLYALLAVWSLYMVASSLFALYIVTLPDVLPRKALKSARELTRHRRWTVLRKILCLPIVLTAAAAVIMVPIIVVVAPLAQWVFLLLTAVGLAATHTYMYALYRELLND